MNILEEMEQNRLQRVRAEEERARKVEQDTKKLPSDVKELVECYFTWPMDPEPFHSSLTNKENLVGYLLKIEGEEINEETKIKDFNFINQVWIKDTLNGQGQFPLNAIKEMRNTKKRKQTVNSFYLENLELF